ncbi:hypothetical protein CKY28_17465 [Sphingomonas lenta]|uniref:Uncharacterized protein n=1 Tax=Sphingomonas lenta TaxID=1141887 RepID=A0A2A2SB28_9SPHN|nr:hypothetical protein CKY28_17465 [Sphingomonas lenta]
MKIEDVVDHLRGEMRRALAQTLKTVAPEVQVDDGQLFREFRRNVSRRCSTWETVPDHCVDKD